MISLVEKHIGELRNVCRKHQVSQMYLFGSAAKGNFTKDSDLDFLVQFSDKVGVLDYADNFFSLVEALEALFERRVDLLTISSLKNPILKEEIEKTKVMLYAA